jgi:hypothetical protein
VQLTGPKIRLWLGYTFALTGAAFVLAALAFGAYETIFLANSSEAQGVVVSNVSRMYTPDLSTGGAAQNVYCPQFEYQSGDGKLHTVTSSSCSAPPSFTVGQKVPVKYQRSDPQGGQIDSFGEKWGLILCFGIIGAILLPPGVVLLRRLRLQGHSLDPLSFWD